MNEITNNQPKNKKRFFLALVFILLALILAFFGYNITNKVLTKFDRILSKEQATVMQLKNLEDKNYQLQNSIDMLREETKQLKLNYLKTNDGKVSAIEHLVTMANLVINATKDPKLAESLLIAAKSYTNDIRLSAIDRALNRDIAKLKNTKTADPSWLIAKLAEIEDQIDRLPLIPKSIKPDPQTIKETTDEAKNSSLWRRFTDNVLSHLKDLVVIRRQSDIPLLNQDQENNLRLNIKTKLLQIELAILQRDNPLYHTCLDQIISLINKYFPLTDQVKDKTIESLRELNKIELTNNLPLPTETLTALANFNNQNYSLNQPQNSDNKILNPVEQRAQII